MQRSLSVKTDESVRDAETSGRGGLLDVREKRHEEQQWRNIQQEQVPGQWSLHHADHQTSEEIIDEYSQTPSRGEGQRLQSDKLDRRVGCQEGSNESVAFVTENGKKNGKWEREFSPLLQTRYSKSNPSRTNYRNIICNFFSINLSNRFLNTVTK